MNHLLLATLDFAVADGDGGSLDGLDHVDVVRGDSLLDAVRVLGTAGRHDDSVRTWSRCRRRCREEGRLATEKKSATGLEGGRHLIYAIASK